MYFNLATVFVPLYIYPSSGAWQPLFQMAKANPSSQFTVVINVNTGPGGSPLQDSNYIAQISNITSQLPNVRKLGYVHTTYATRNISDVKADVEAYAAWAAQSSLLRMDGIFFDEAPTTYSSVSVSYMSTIYNYVKSNSNFGKAYVVTNPGQVPSAQYVQYADLIVVYEDVVANFATNTLSENSNSAQIPQKQRACSLHSIPTPTDSKFSGYVQQANSVCGSVFVTDLTTNYYNAWSTRFPLLVSGLKTQSNQSPYF